MRPFTLKKALCVLLFGVVAAVGYAQLSNVNDGNTMWQNNVVVNSTLTAPTISGVTTLAATTANVTTVNATTLNVATAFTNNGIEIMPPTAVSLTSPTVTTTAAGARMLVITTDETQTGLIINGGTLNQVITVRGTSDSATIRIDDGTSYTTAGNLVLGLDDYTILQCLEAGNPASRWGQVGGSLN